MSLFFSTTPTPPSRRRGIQIDSFLYFNIPKTAIRNVMLVARILANKEDNA